MLADDGIIGILFAHYRALHMLFTMVLQAGLGDNSEFEI